MGLVAAEIESLFTADLRPFEQAAKTYEARSKTLDGKTLTTKVDADVRTALANVDKLEDRVRRSNETVDIDADTSVAESKIDGLSDAAAAAGADGGGRAGKNLGAGIIAALATIPIAGAVVGIGQAIGDSLLEGLNNEVRGDILAARTGLDVATVGRLATAAGEAYAGNFGASIDANMDTARRAIESGLLDPAATQRDAQAVIQSLSGVADVLEEDVSAVARSSSQLLRTGLASSAQEAFDIIVRGQQAGLNVSEDWLDTLDEYGTQFRKLGLEGGDVLGLLQQGVQGGARDTDIAADAFKELSIRAVDGSKLTAEGFEAIGKNAEEMSDKFAAGGDSAREALGDTLDGLRSIEDPVKRDAAAVALFGTQAEDLGKALYAMDLDTASRQFQDLEGSAQRALDTLGDNTAGKIASAQRNIELAGDGIKGALAEAFAPQLEGFATFVSENREEVVRFLFDAANGAIDFGRSLAEAAAAGTEGFGDFVGETGPAVLGAIDAIVQGMGRVGLITDEEAQEFADFTAGAVKGMEDFDKSTEVTADKIRTTLIDNALDPAQEKLNDLGSGLISNAALSDATNQLASDISGVGYAADGSKASLDDFDGSLDTSTRSGAQLDKQMRGVATTLNAQVRAAAGAGESQKELRGRVESARQAFIDQVQALGATAGQAEKLANKYGLIPSEVVTRVVLDLSEAQAALARFRASATVRAQIDDGRSRSGFAGGGYTGPGGKFTPAGIVHAEEFVIRSESTKGIQAAAPGLLDALNADGAKVLGLGGYANGGAVGDAADAVEKRRRDLSRARDELRRARRGSSESRLNDAENAVDRAERALEDARSRRERLAALTSDTKRDLRRGEFGGDLSTVDALIERSQDGDLSRRQRRNLAETAREAERELSRLDRRAASLAKNIERAADKTADLRDISDNVSSNLIGEFSLAGGGSQTNQFGETVAAAASASGVVGSINSTAARIREFGKKLKALAKAGLKGRALDEIAGLGSIQGSALADEFLSDQKQIEALNSAFRSLDSAGDFAGQSVTEGYYKGGLSQAEGYLKGLERDQARLDKQYERQGSIMARAIARALGIKARASGGPVDGGSPYLVGEQGPELVVPYGNGTVLTAQQTRGLNGATVTSTATFTDAQVAVLARAVRDGAATGLAGHERAQSSAARYVRGI